MSSGTLRLFFFARGSRLRDWDAGEPPTSWVGVRGLFCGEYLLEQAGCTAETNGACLGRATRQVAKVRWTYGGAAGRLRYNRPRRSRRRSAPRRIFVDTRIAQRRGGDEENCLLKVDADWRAQVETWPGVSNAVDAKETQSAERRAKQNACWARCRKDSEVECGVLGGGGVVEAANGKQLVSRDRTRGREAAELESWRCRAGGKHGWAAGRPS